MRRVWLLAIVLCVVVLPPLHAQSGFDGKWEGQTLAGRQVALNLTVTGSQLTGTFTLEKQTVPIAEGKIVA